MAIDNVIAKIKSSADEKRAELIKEADAEKAKILAEWQDKAGEFYKEERKKIETEVANEKRSVILAKKLELRKELLTVKQGIIDEAFDQALEKMKTMPKKDYEQLLSKLLEAFAEDGEEVIGKKEDSAVLKSIVKKAGKDLKVSSETRDISGGFILVKGKIEKNVSFETIMETERNKLEQEVGKLLNVF